MEILMQHDGHVRLECLRLATQQGYRGDEALRRARTMAVFVFAAEIEADTAKTSDPQKIKKPVEIVA